MISQIIFKRAFWILVITGVANLIASKFYLYWTLPRVDMVVHFFAGLTVALATLWLCSLRFDISKWKVCSIFCFALLGSISVGILWEIYELHFGITSISDGIYYFMDTGSDLTMDTVGGIAGFFYTSKLIKKLKYE